MTDQEVDRLMRRVLLDVIKGEQAAQGEDGQVFAPSAQYRRQMTAMETDPLQWARRRARPLWKSALRRVAAILLACFLSLGSLMAVNPTVRAAVLRWVVEWYETNVTYRYSGAPMTEEMPRYAITALPEGYAEVESERVEWPSAVLITYRDDAAENATIGQITLDYCYMQQGTAWDFLTEEGTEVILVTVNGMEGKLFMKKDWKNKWSSITWIDSVHNLQFTVDAALSKNDILHIAESVSLVELTK